MDPPPPSPPQPPPPLSTTTTTTMIPSPNITTQTTTTTTTYPDSIDSSPGSRTTDSYFDDPPQPLQQTQPPQQQTSVLSKLRLMCSYGGHIIPRPHDKSLCYVGGDTRMVVVDRHTSLSSLTTRLSNTLLNGRSFTLKYQLPNEDLDSLISVTTDEDLENMIDEYERTNNNPTNNSNNNNSGNTNNLNNLSKPSRIRLFLFPTKPDSSQSIGPILDNSVKSEDWFLNALNGGLNRGFSDSASVNCLLGLDDGGSVGGDTLIGSNNSNKDMDSLLLINSNSNNKNVKQQSGGGVGGQDVHSVPDSPMLETTSSFGSTSSSPSLANLPPIRVHVDEQKAVGAGVFGMEEQFAQIGFGSGGGQRQDEVNMVLASPPPPMPVSIALPGVTVGAPVVVGEYQNRVFSDDERLDHGVPVSGGGRKPLPPQLQQQPQQQQQQNLTNQAQQKSSGGGNGSGGGAIDLPSPDSVSSDSSFSNPVNRQKPTMVYQDPVVQMPPSGVNRVPASANPVDSKVNVSDPNTRVQIQQQVQDSGYVLQPQLDQQQQHQQQPQQQPQQFIPAHYIHHHPAGAVPISAYYPMYPTQQQHHPQHHHQLDQQFPVYYVQARQPQAYNLPMQQPNISESAATIPSSRPQTTPNPTMLPPPAAYNPMRNAPIAKPEMAAAGMYRTTTTGAPQLVQVPSGQNQPQYVGYSQLHHPSQSVAPTSAGTANYAYELADPAHAQIYYTQPLAPTMPSQYQTMTAAAAMVLPEASSQLPADSMKMKQQIRTSQAI